MRRPCPAAVLVGGAAVALLAGDAVLVRRGERLVTDTLREPFPLACLLVLVLHVLDVLGPLDPFRAACRRIQRA